VNAPANRPGSTDVCALDTNILSAGGVYVLAPRGATVHRFHLSDGDPFWHRDPAEGRRRLGLEAAARAMFSEFD
jgi:hypothetical protein